MLDETIHIPHYAAGWGESSSAKLGVQCSYGGTLLERESKGPSKKSEGDLRSRLVYMLLVSRQVPVSQQYWRKRIGPSLADRSRVELALLPRLTRLSRTQSLFGGSFVLHSLAITRRERSNQGAYYHIERSEA